MVHYFVWYRVGSGLHAESGNDRRSFRRAADAVLDDVQRVTGIRGILLRRREQADTWMEVYEGVADPKAFEHELAAAVARHGLAQYLHESGRHVEAFVAAEALDGVSNEAGNEIANVAANEVANEAANPAVRKTTG